MVYHKPIKRRGIISKYRDTAIYKEFVKAKDINNEKLLTVLKRDGIPFDMF